MRGLNPDILAVAPPPIPEARRWASLYDGRLGPAIDLTQAVPGYPPHPDLVARLAEAATRPESFAYGEITGDPALREVYAADASSLYGGAISPGAIAITTGANMASFAVTMLLARAGEAIMLPVPWYFNHQMNAAMLGIRAVPLPCRPEDGFVPDPERAAALLDESVRAIFLVTPNNPTGANYPPNVIAAFAELCRRRGIRLVLDETYRDFRPAELDRPHDLFADPQWREDVIGLYSFSKSYCVPGYRLGAVTAGESTMRQLVTVLDCLQICAARVGQAALAWAIPALTEWRERNRAIMNGRAAAARAAFDRLDGWRIDGCGAYFAYARHPDPEIGSFRVAERLAVEAGVVTLPGAAFGPEQEAYLRLAFANVESEAIEAVARRLSSTSVIPGLAEREPGAHKR